jgi:hypothetical protein
MKNALKYVGIVALCAAGTVSLLAHKPKDDGPAIVRDKHGMGYHVDNGKLLGPYYEVIRPWGVNGIRTYSAGSNCIVHLYNNDKRIKVEFYDKDYCSPTYSPTETIDESVDAESVQHFVKKFRENQKMLREAGLLD